MLLSFVLIFLRLFVSVRKVVVVHNSELLAGSVEKNHLGSGTKNSIFYLILRDFGELESAQSLSRLARLTSAYISMHLMCTIDLIGLKLYISSMLL